MINIKKSQNVEYFGNTLFESIAVGSAYELLRNDHIEHLKIIEKELGFKYCRFHGLFHDNMAVARRKADGKLAFQWHHIDKVIDTLLSIGLRPFLELNSMPRVMIKGDPTYAFSAGWKMITNEPYEYDEWAELVENFVRHIVDRYGLDEVKLWYFEVWNEPNLKSFWPAGVETYLKKLYPAAAFAVKRVHQDLKVGGPATAGGRHISDIINYCYENNVPLDFISTHEYPIGEYCNYIERKDSPFEIGMYFAGQFERVKKEVENSPMPNLPIHWTEWNTQSGNSSKNITWTNNPTVDNHFGGACVVRNMLLVRNLCESVAYWTASDIFSESGQAHSPFSCTYGLLNIQGIKKATFNGYKLLKKMRGIMLDCGDKFNQGCGMNATEENGVIRVLAYNQQLLEVKNQPNWNEELIISVNDDGDYVITTAKIEKGQGSCYETWLNMGSPQNLSKTQEEALRFSSEMKYDTKIVKAENSTIRTAFNLCADEVIYIEIQKRDIVSLPKNITDEEIKKLDNDLMVN